MGSNATASSPTIESQIGPTAKNVSTATFARGVLAGIKAPINNTNIANVQRWIGLEQGSNLSNWLNNQNNPLGVTTPGQGVTPLSSPYEGVKATVSTLLGSTSYSNIVSSLRNSAPAPIFAQALVAAPWQSGKTGGTTYSGQTASQIATMTPFTGQFTVGQFTPKPIIPANQILPTIAQPVTSAVHAVTSVSGLIGKVTNPTNLKNVGIFTAGIALTITGLVILFSSSKTGRMVEGTAIKGAMA